MVYMTVQSKKLGMATGGWVDDILSVKMEETQQDHDPHTYII